MLDAAKLLAVARQQTALLRLTLTPRSVLRVCSYSILICIVLP